MGENSCLKIHGLKIHTAYTCVYVCVYVCVVVWSCGPYFNACKVTTKKRHPQHEKRLQIKFFNNIMI